MIWYPYEQMKTMREPYKIVDANGVYLYTEDQKLIDSVSSWWCMIHGYKHPELTAAIKALESLKGVYRVRLVADSHYLVKGLSEWLPNWKAREWRNSDGKPVANQDLWQKLDHFNIRHKIDCYWVKGHAGHPLNERADALARQGLEENLGG